MAGVKINKKVEFDAEVEKGTHRDDLTEFLREVAKTIEELDSDLKLGNLRLDYDAESKMFNIHFGMGTNPTMFASETTSESTPQPVQQTTPPSPPQENPQIDDGINKQVTLKSIVTCFNKAEEHTFGTCGPTGCDSPLVVEDLTNRGGDDNIWKDALAMKDKI